MRDYLIRELDMNCTNLNNSQQDMLISPSSNDIENANDTLFSVECEQKKTHRTAESSYNHNFNHFYQPQYEEEEVNDILY